MNDKELIERLYHKMYTAMINKDRAVLERIYTDSFVLERINGSWCFNGARALTY